MIWTNEYLDRLRLEAEEEIARETKCLIDRISLPTQKYQSEYQLPDYVIDVRKVYWKGIRLNPISDLQAPDIPIDIRIWHDGAFSHTGFTDAFNIGFYTVDNFGIGGNVGGCPYEYFYYGFGENVISIRPSADEVLDFYPSGTWESEILKKSLVVEFYRTADGVDWKIPQYFRRRTIKAYVLWKAFNGEGPGQNLKAAQYFEAKFRILLARAKRIVDNVYRAYKRVAPAEEYDMQMNHLGRYYNFDGDYGYQGKFKPARPTLPKNYGITLED